MKVYYVCECCKEVIQETDIGSTQLNLTGETENDIINADYSTMTSLNINTVCDDCLAALGWTDEGLSGWFGGLRIWRH